MVEDMSDAWSWWIEISLQDDGDPEGHRGQGKFMGRLPVLSHRAPHSEGSHA